MLCFSVSPAKSVMIVTGGISSQIQDARASRASAKSAS